MQELKRLRNELGWSQQRLADESGVNKATINQVEQGKRSPTITTLESLARAMGAEVGDFFPKAQASLPFEAGGREDARGVDVSGMVLAAARRQAEQDRQAANRALESERPQTYFMRHENEVVVRLLEECAPDAVAGTLVEMARRCVQLESQLSKEATSAPARSAAT